MTRFPITGPALAAFLALLCLVLPLVAGDYYVSLGTEIAIMVLMLSSYRVVVLTGEWSFAHVVLQGVGAYTAAILAKDHGAPFPLSLAAGAVTAALVAGVLSFPLLKMRGFYFRWGPSPRPRQSGFCGASSNTSAAPRGSRASRPPISTWAA
jgi:branched-chain amino acid transport system permease protein